MQQLAGFSRLILIAVLATGLLGACGGDSKNKRHAANAEQAFQSGDYNRAEIEFKNVLRADPDNVRALARMGTIWLDRGGPVQAARLLTRVRELAADDCDSRVKLATALLALNDRSAAYNEVREVLAIAPAHGDALLVMAIIAETSEQMAEAEQALEAMRESEDVALPLATAVLAMRKRDLAAAEQALNQALSIDAESALVHTWKGRWHQLRGEVAEAEEALKTGAGLAPARSAERMAYASFLLAEGKNDAALAYLRQAVKDAPDFLSAWRLLGREALSREDYQEAGTMFAHVFAKDPLDYEAALLQSEAWLAGGDPKEIDKAVKLLGNLNRAFPGSPVIETRLAKAHLVEGKSAPAVAALERALGMNPDFGEAVLTKAMLDLREGRAAAAETAMRQRLTDHPADGQAALILAEACRAQGQLEESMAILKSLADAPGADSQSQFRLGLAYRQQGNAEAAAEAFEKALEMQPSNLPAAVELVRLDMLRSDFDSALRRAEEQKKLHPESAYPLFLSASVLARQERWKRAEEDLHAALRLDPGMLAAHGLLVRIHATTGRMAKLRGQLENMRETDPGNVAVLMTLAGLHESEARMDEAITCYREILEKHPQHAPALNNLAVLLGDAPDADLDEALRLAQLARFANKEDPAIADTLGWILFKRGEFRRAHGLLAQAAERITDNPLVHYHFGMACRAMGLEETARTALRAALALQTDFPAATEAVAALAALDATIEPGAAGIEILQQQIRDNPADMVARLRLAARLEADERYREAADAYEDALKINPDLHPAASRLALLNIGPLNADAKAYEYARKAMELDPGDARATAVLGTIAFRAREFERAHLMFQGSLLKIKDDSGLMLQAANAAYAVGELNETSKLMESVAAQSKEPDELAESRRFLALQKPDCPPQTITETLSADPDYVPALMARAALAEKGNQTQAALEDYEKVLKILPDFKPAAEAIKRLTPEDDPEP